MLSSRSISASELENLWERYKRTRGKEERDQLLLNYAPLVRYVADRVAISLPRSVDTDDLISEGVIGLFDALEKFQPNRGVKFETYALARIRGAIIDGLRESDWVPRTVRQKARELERVVAELEASLGRSASDREIIEALGISPAEYHRRLREIRATTLASLDEVWNPDAPEDSQLHYLEMVAHEQPGPDHRIEEVELRSELARAIDRLPERERLVISLYYYEGLTLKEIGKVLGVSESRVCQLHTKSLVRLRGHLRRALAG